MTNPETIVDQDTEPLQSKQALARLQIEIEERIGRYKPNTAIASCMEWLNQAITEKHTLSQQSIENSYPSFQCLSHTLQANYLKNMSQKIKCYAMANG